jgi:hypothetical protein
MSLAELSQGKTNLTNIDARGERFWYDDCRGIEAIEQPCYPEEDEEEDDEAPLASVQSKTLFSVSATLPNSDVTQQNIGRMVRFHYYRTVRLRVMSAAKFMRSEPKRTALEQPNTAEQVKIRELLERAAETLKSHNRASAEITLDEVLALLQQALETIQSATTKPEMRTVLETFDGYVDSIEGENAYVTLESRENGDVLYGEFPASELLGKNISEQTSFLCETVKTINGSRIEFRALPKIEVTDKEARSIAEKMRGTFSGDDCSDIEY